MKKPFIFFTFYLASIILILGCGQPSQRPFKKSSNCKHLLSGAVTPFKDFISFTDQNYPEVTLTSQRNWNQKRLPKKVKSLQKKGYICNPLPEEFENMFYEPGMLSEPAVQKVRWNCELEYNQYQYLRHNKTKKKKELIGKDLKCEKITCQDLDDPFIWFCHK